MTYREIIVRGDEKIMKGFLVGYCTSNRIKSGLVLARDHDINRHHLREILRFRPHYLHLVVRSDHYRALASTLRRVEKELNMTVISDRAIRRAWLEYDFETFNRRVARTIKRFFANLPEGIKRTGRKHEEHVDPHAKGVEMYSPAHDYAFRGKGQLTGDLERLLRLHPKMKAHEFIDVGDINLKH